MSFDKTELFSNIIDARRNDDSEDHCRLVLRHLASFDDGIVHAPEGIVKLLHAITEISKRTIQRHLESLERRSIFSKESEFTLQLNSQFSSKGMKLAPYKGSRIKYDQSELEHLFTLETKGLELLNLRGKNKPIRKKDENMNSTAVIQTLTKQLDVKDRQIEELLSIVRKISRGEEVSQTEAKTKLALVYPIKKEQP